MNDYSTQRTIKVAYSRPEADKIKEQYPLSVIKKYYHPVFGLQYEVHIPPKWTKEELNPYKE